MRNQQNETNGEEILTVTVEQAADSLGISRTGAYMAVRRGELPAIRLGRRLVVPKVVLELMIAKATERLGMLDVAPALNSGEEVRR